MPQSRESERSHPTETIYPVSSVAIIGIGGQIGQFLAQELGEDSGIKQLTGVARGQADDLRSRLPHVQEISSLIAKALASQPQVVILATPNPTKEVLTGISQHVQHRFILVLPQNGVNVGPVAQKVIPKYSPVRLVRTSIFTPVSATTDGVDYNHQKRRIAFAPIRDTERHEATRRVQELFNRNGFETCYCDNFVSMEWTKLLLNCLGSTGAVTGYTPEQTFNDPDLFGLELQGMRDRIQILKKAGVPIVGFPWLNMSRLTWVIRNLPDRPPAFVRNFVARHIASGRDDLPPASWRKIESGARETEQVYYHNPFIEEGEKSGLGSMVDTAIKVVLERHASGDIDLTIMTADKRRGLLLNVYTELKEGQRPETAEIG